MAAAAAAVGGFLSLLSPFPGFWLFTEKNIEGKRGGIEFHPSFYRLNRQSRRRHHAPSVGETDIITKSLTRTISLNSLDIWLSRYTVNPNTVRKYLYSVPVSLCLRAGS